MLPGMPPSAPQKPNLNEAQRSQMFDELDHFELWFATTWQWLWRGAIVVVAIAVVALIIYEVQKAGESKVNEAFAAIEFDNSLSTTDRMTQLEGKIAEYPTAPAADLARLTVANEAVKSANYDKAMGIFTELFENQTTIEPIRVRAQINKAYILMNKAQNDSAIAVLENLRGELPQMTPFALLECNYALATLYTASKNFEKLDPIIQSFETDRLMATAISQSPLSFVVNRLIGSYKANRTNTIGADLSKIGVDMSKIGPQPSPAPVKPTDTAKAN